MMVTIEKRAILKSLEDTCKIRIAEDNKTSAIRNYAYLRC